MSPADIIPFPTLTHSRVSRLTRWAQPPEDDIEGLLTYLHEDLPRECPGLGALSFDLFRQPKDQRFHLEVGGRFPGAPISIEAQRIADAVVAAIDELRRIHEGTAAPSAAIRATNPIRVP